MSIENSTDSAWVTLAYALTFDMGMLLVVLCAFSLVHELNFWHRMLAPRNAVGEKGAFVKPVYSGFASLKQVLFTREEEIIRISGLDSAVLVRFHIMCMQLFGILCCTLFPVLIAVYQLGSNPDGVTGIDQVSFSNLKNDSIYMWSTTAALYFLTLVTFFLLWRHTLHVLSLRRRWFADDKRGLEPHNFATVVMCIPPSTIAAYPGVARLRKKKKKWWRKHTEEEQNHELKGDELEAPRAPPMTPSDLKTALREMLGCLRVASTCFFHIPGVGPKEVKWDYPGVAAAPEHDGRPALGSGKQVVWSKVQQYAQPGEPIIPSHITIFFERLFGDELLHLQPVYSEKLVKKAYKKWRQALCKLNRARMKWEKARLKAEAAGEVHDKGGEDLIPRHRVNKFCFCFEGDEVESIPYWIEEVKSAAEKLREAQANAFQNPISSAVIAIFRTRKAAALCRMALRPSGHWSWRALRAYPAQEMWWDNLRFTAFQDNFREIWAYILTLAMLVFYYLPVTAVASLASGRAVSTAIGQQKEEVGESTMLPPFLQAIVPALSLQIVLGIFAPIFLLIAKWEGRISKTDAILVTSSRYYYVVVANILIAYTLTSSLFQELYELATFQTTVWDLFAANIPGAAAFYIQYTLNNSLFCGLELGRLPIPILGFLFKRFALGKQTSDRERNWDQGILKYSTIVGTQNLIVTIGIVYCVISPLILPFTMLWCLITFLTWKHQVMYVYKDPSDMGGLYWIRFVHHILNALIIAQITTIGLLGAKEAYAQMGTAVGTIPLTVAVHLWLTIQYGSFFRRDPLDILALDEEYDEVRKGTHSPFVHDPAKLAQSFFPGFMRPPVMPDLDPLAPSDPDVWKHLHPIKHLSHVENYFPTPKGVVQREGGREAEGLWETRDPCERSFWEITEVVPMQHKAEGFISHMKKLGHFMMRMFRIDLWKRCWQPCC